MRSWRGLVVLAVLLVVTAACNGSSSQREALLRLNGLGGGPSGSVAPDQGGAAVPSEPKSPMSGKRFDRALAALARVAETGERPVAAANALVGPSPFVVHLLLGSLGRFLLLKSSLLWITDRRVVLIRLSNWNGRPKAVTFADPRSSVALMRAESRTLWLRRADGTEYRLNQVRKAEAAWISQALGGPLA